MSFAEARIEEYRISRASRDQPLTEVYFEDVRVGNMDIRVVAENRQMATESESSEDQIERQLAQEGLIRVPPSTSRTRSDFEPIDVAGKPISEMIIEERR